MAGRPRKPLPLPTGFQRGEPVKVTSPELKGVKGGLIVGLCKEGGIEIWLTGDSTPGHSVYACIHTERGDTIESVGVRE